MQGHGVWANLSLIFFFFVFHNCVGQMETHLQNCWSRMQDVVSFAPSLVSSCVIWCKYETQKPVLTSCAPFYILFSPDGTIRATCRRFATLQITFTWPCLTFLVLLSPVMSSHFFCSFISFLHDVHTHYDHLMYYHILGTWQHYEVHVVQYVLTQLNSQESTI